MPVTVGTQEWLFPYSELQLLSADLPCLLDSQSSSRLSLLKLTRGNSTSLIPPSINQKQCGHVQGVRLRSSLGVSGRFSNQPGIPPAVLSLSPHLVLSSLGTLGHFLKGFASLGILALSRFLIWQPYQMGVG